MSTQRNKLYWIWAAMIKRCNNPNDKGYKNYGARGIKVCERWHIYTNFLADMGPRPEGLMLERIDNNAGYNPENCKWATRKENNSNRRNCIYLSHNGEKVTLKEYCRRLGLRYRPIVKRIQDRGWSIERAISVPVFQMNE
jgi:hypothetical protein